MYTEFALDGVMRDSISKTINVNVEPEKIEILNSYNIRQIEKQNLQMVVRPLAQTINTNITESLGLSEAGRKIALKLNLDTDSKSIKNIKLYIGKSQLDKKSLAVGSILNDDIKNNIYTKNKQILLLDFEIPKEIPPTINGWKSLREKTSSYFSARQEENLGSRKSAPYILFVEFEYMNKIHNYEILIDIIDDYISNVNYSLESQVLNKTEIKELSSFESWITNE